MENEYKNSANADCDKEESDFVKIAIPKKVNEYIPDFIQNTIMEQMDNIEEQIKAHEAAITELNALYVAHANFLTRYSPFETGNLSQDVSIDMAPSPGAFAPGREEGQMNESIKSAP